MRLSTVVAAAGIAALSLGQARAVDIAGAGATFPYPVYAKWADAYKKETGNNLNYQSIGSGAGIRQVIAKTVTFGATDRPLKIDRLQKEALVQWPQIMGALVVVINLPGLKPGEVILDGPTLAGIYMGKVTRWDDPAIVRLNPSIRLPAAAITVVRRSDGSGTTFLFTDYLSRVSAEWKQGYGSGTVVEWPVGVGAKGNEGVAANVLNTKYAIGYVEYAIARHTGMTYTALVNKAGRTVQPDIAAFQSAAASADWSKEPGYYQILNEQPGEATWPIVGASFILMPKNPPDKAAGREALRFFGWAFDNGGKMAGELDFIPMPDNVIGMIRQTWSREIALD